MIQRGDNEYQDPNAPGSLVSTLRLWQALVAEEHAAIPQYVSFTLQCKGEARANRLASGLRRRLACKTATVSRAGADGVERWQVVGVTHRQLQSLENLEHVSSWLRAAAVSYQVDLVRMSLVGNMA